MSENARFVSVRCRWINRSIGWRPTRRRHLIERTPSHARSIFANLIPPVLRDDDAQRPKQGEGKTPSLHSRT